MLRKTTVEAYSVFVFKATEENNKCLFHCNVEKVAAPHNIMYKVD